MPKICYVPKTFSDDKLVMIREADRIIVEYGEQGFDLTLRQLYYQFVSRGLIANKQKEYAKLGDLISDARLAGLIDWSAIVDRTRNLAGNSHWDKPSDAIRAASKQYLTNLWDVQPEYVEVWIEKDALKGVISGICTELDVPFFSCRGYTSQSEMWGAAQRLMGKIHKGKRVHIIHLGDHDPSGIDMSRDIKGRLELFCHQPVHVQRVALNMPQIERYNPPPNPAKVTDSRFESYQQKFGDESWELDALAPPVIVDVVRRAVMQFVDETRLKEAKQNQERGRTTLQMVAEHFPAVVQMLRSLRQKTLTVYCSQCGANEEQPYCHCEGRNLTGPMLTGGTVAETN